MRALNPGLIYVSVTPYGQNGPKAHWPATELTIEAAAGRLALQGDKDRPPIPIGYPQAAFHAGSQAAADASSPSTNASCPGAASTSTLSMQAAMTWTLMNYMGYPALTGGDPPGQGDDRADPAAAPQRAVLALVPCADGFILATNTLHEQTARILARAPSCRSLRKPRQFTRRARSRRLGSMAGGGAGRQCRHRCRSALPTTPACFLPANDEDRDHDLGLGERHAFASVHTTQDLLENPHFEARGFWQKVGDYIHPGPSARLTPHAQSSLDRPAPDLGARPGPRSTAWLQGCRLSSAPADDGPSAPARRSRA